ncbi:HotDog domain-containing protein [Gautieria morchelliformis]|nr:HotDog domain-containing protein [Gautieria morchelliformis]
MSQPASLAALEVAGNASQETKQACLEQFNFITGAGSPAGFAWSIGRRLHLSQIDVEPNVEEQGKKEAKVVCGITVEPVLQNAIGTLHGGCTAFLIDDCSALPLIVLGHEQQKNSTPGVSQNLSIYYHAPAFVGSELRIVSTSLAYGSRIMSSRSEIWDRTKQRLIASGVHTMMHPSPSRPG